MNTKFNLQFKVNPLYVFLHAINMNQGEEPFGDWAKFTNAIWERNPEIFYFLAGAAEHVLYVKNTADYRKLFSRNLQTLSKIQKSKEFKRLVKETEQYKKLLEKQWEKNKDKALTILQELSGLSLPNHMVTINLSHPALRNGMTIDDNNIAWGHKEEYLNYSIVYICHELLHIMTKHDNSDVLHAAIELLADNELRIRLNKKGRYFEHENHWHLKEIEKKLYPAWKQYLKQDKKNILQFAKKHAKTKRG